MAENVSRIDELQRRLEREPGSRLFAQLAEELRKSGEFAEAIRVARGGLAQHPNYPSARMTLGRALLDSGDAAAAKVEFEAVLRGSPDNILASRLLAEALEAVGDSSAALEQYRAALVLAPGDRVLEGRLGKLEQRIKAPPPPAAAPAAGATGPAPAVEGGGLPPTIRIHRPGDPVPRPAVVSSPPPLPGRMGASPSPPPAKHAPPPLPSEPPLVPERPPLEALPPLAPPPAEHPDESETAPTDPTARAPELAALEEPLPATLPPGTVTTSTPPSSPPSPPDDTTLRPEVEPEDTPAVPAAGVPSSATLAELYFGQGLMERAVEVYEQVLAQDPLNEKARARLVEIRAMAGPPASGDAPAEAGAGGEDAERLARRRALERTIAGLEDLLAVVRRR